MSAALSGRARPRYLPFMVGRLLVLAAALAVALSATDGSVLDRGMSAPAAGARDPLVPVRVARIFTTHSAWRSSWA
jgi:hypothetical protein